MSTIQTHEGVIHRPELEKFFRTIASETNALIDDVCTEQVKLFPCSQLAAAFSALHHRLDKDRQQRAAQLRQTAEQFNVFDYIAPDENLLSDVLRLLLDPQGSHGQGDAFLCSLIHRVNSTFSGDCQDASVVREAITYSIKHFRRRIDVLATIPGFVLAIETKKFSGEGGKQIHDYCEHLRNIASENFCLIFLTRTGAEAASIAPEVGTVLQRKGRLKCWSWEREICNWLTECASKCEAPKMRHFIEDFQTYIDTFLATQVNPEQNNESQ
jgi:hypothetical protein